jgi:hypothetical protein
MICIVVGVVDVVDVVELALSTSTRTTRIGMGGWECGGRAYREAAL